MLRMPSLHRGLTHALVGLVLAAAGCGGTDVRSVTALTWETHLDHFPIDRGAHQWADCDACHGEFSTFTEFSCIGCHTHAEADTSPAHAGVVGYVYDATGCYGCHPDGTAEGAAIDHGPFFPIDDASAHRDTRCAECHPNPSDREDVSCVGCHHEPARTRAEHDAAGGFQDDSPSCMKCHFRSDVPDLGAHGFRIDAEASHRPDEAACLECHGSLIPEAPFPAADFEPFDCSGCHLQPDMAAVHQSLSGYAYDSPTCVGCHPNGENEGAVDHAPFFPIETGSAHEDAACADCHPEPSDREAVSCVGCHHEPSNTQSEHTRVGGYVFDSPTCMKCHYRSEVVDVDRHLPFRIDGRAEHRPREAGCLECHPRLRSETAFPAADWVVFDCTGCHSRSRMDDEHRERPGYAYDSSTCVSSGCHPDGGEKGDD